VTWTRGNARGDLFNNAAFPRRAQCPPRREMAASAVHQGAWSCEVDVSVSLADSSRSNCARQPALVAADPGGTGPRREGWRLTPRLSRVGATYANRTMCGLAFSSPTSEPGCGPGVSEAVPAAARRSRSGGERKGCAGADRRSAMGAPRWARLTTCGRLPADTGD